MHHNATCLRPFYRLNFTEEFTASPDIRAASAIKQIKPELEPPLGLPEVHFYFTFCASRMFDPPRRETSR